MSAPTYIRRHINNFVGDKPFSIRDFLIYGSRNVVDQIFHKMVLDGRIIRVARGVYIKDTAPMPTAEEVAQVKAAAFGRTIAKYAGTAQREQEEKQSRSDLVFASSGSTSSFQFGLKTIRFIRRSARKLQLGDSRVGIAIRRLWHTGKKMCTGETAAEAILDFQREDTMLLRRAGAVMPAWLRDCFSTFLRMDCIRTDLEPRRAC